MNIKQFTNEQNFLSAATSLIQEISPRTIGLSGGSTPVPFYQEIAKNDDLQKLFQIKNTQFFQTDERYIPPHHPDSNQRMIRQTLKPLNFHHFDTTLPIDACLQKYQKQLPTQFDLLILGIGPDGHTSSLFPKNQPANGGHQNPDLVHTQTDQFAVKDRLTLAWKPILSAKNLLVLLKNKPQVLTELQSPTHSPEGFPAHHLIQHPNLTILSLEE